MTKEQILDRIKILTTEREQAKAMLSAYDGALQDCKFWLTKIEEEQTNDEQARD